MYYYHEVEEWGPFYAEIEIEYEIHGGDKMVRYDRNGDGYPGSPPEIEIIAVRVTHLENDDFIILQAPGCDDLGGWEQDLDRLALDYVESHDYITSYLPMRSYYD